MKKAFTISFLLLYLVLNAGLNILVHTCGGESETFVATTTVEDPCVCGDDMSPQDQSRIDLAGMCCTTVLKTVQLDDAQKTTVSIEPIPVVDVDYLPVTSISLFTIQHSLFAIQSNTSPPAKDFQASNSVFLI